MRKPITEIKLIKVNGEVHTMEVCASLNAVEIARDVMQTNKAIRQYIIHFKPVISFQEPIDILHSFIKQITVN